MLETLVHNCDVLVLVPLVPLYISKILFWNKDVFTSVEAARNLKEEIVVGFISADGKTTKPTGLQGFVTLCVKFLEKLDIDDCSMMVYVIMLAKWNHQLY